MTSLPSFLVETPFGEPIPTVPLPRAPLALVIAQVRFPAVLAIDADVGRVAAFQDLIRNEYPLVQQTQELAIAVAEPGFAPDVTKGLIYRFSSPDHGWRVSLGRSFVAIHTDVYTARPDFLSRIDRVLAALTSAINPGICERVGVRYYSRVSEADLVQRLGDLVRPEVLGTGGGGELGDEAAERVHTVTDSMYRLPAALLRARWGLVPGGATLDPNVAPVETESFVIDLDVFSATPTPLDPTDLRRRVEEFCGRQYRFFRWMVTPAFLAAFGGEG